MIKRICAALALALLLASCAPESEVYAPALIKPVSAKIDTARVERGTVQSVKMYPGMVRYMTEELFLGETGLRFGEYMVLPGDRVTEGQLIAALNAESLEKQLEDQEESIARVRGEHDYENARISLDIDETRYNYITLARKAADFYDEEMMRAAENMRLEVERLRQNQEQTRQRQALTLRHMEEQAEKLRTRIAESKLYAPYDGIITYTTGKQRNHWVDAFETLAYIAGEQVPHVELYTEVAVRVGRNSKIIADWEGVIIPIEPIPIQRSEEMKYALLRISAPLRFKFLSDERGLPPLGANVSIIEYTYYEEDALRIPSNALYGSEGEGYYVYLNKNGHKESVQITVFHVSEAFASIAGEIAEGDEVYVKP